MPRVGKLLLASLLFAFLYAASASAVRADPIVITFTNPVQTAAGGSSGVFSASFTNAGTAPVTVLGALVDYNVIGSFTGNVFFLDYTSTFLSLASPSHNGFTLAPGESTGVIPIFSFTLSPSFAGPPITLDGRFVVSYGDVFNPANTLGTANWTLTILASPDPQPEPTPEPATVLLLGTGLAGAAAKAFGKRRRRRRPV
jgi:hypothetical protein